MKLLPLFSLLSAAYAVPGSSSSATPSASASASPSSSPSSSPNSAFTLNIRWSNSPLKGPLNANGNSFWTGKPTSSYCPETVPGCQEVNTTSFTASADGRLYLNTAVPGGQQVYISPQGLLTYTVPHSAYIPAGSLTNFATWSVGTDGKFLNPFLTFWLCNSEEASDAWNVWTEYTNGTTGSITNNGMTGENACTRIALEAEAYAGEGAWQF